jgi:integrase/recombinase XerD
LASLLDHLRDLGVVGPEPASVVNPLIEAYRAWMLEKHGLAPLTGLRYEKVAVRFVATLGGRQLGSLNGSDVNRFLLAEASRVSVGAAKGRVAEMHSLLWFLFLTGRLDCDLAASVPPVAGWHDQGVPRGAKAPDLDRLLAACDPATLTGCRDSGHADVGRQAGAAQR